MALGVAELNELNQRLSEVINPSLPVDIRETISRGQDILNVFRSIGLRPKKVTHAPVQEIVKIENPSLDFLPILQCWPKDGGRFITLPQVITRDPETNVRNVGMYRLQVVQNTNVLPNISKKSKSLAPLC